MSAGVSGSDTDQVPFRPLHPPNPTGTVAGQMVKPLENRALIVGASSGIGEALAHRLARQGYHVALLARRKDHLERICQEIAAAGVPGKATAYALDAAQFAEVPKIFDQIVTELGGIDLMIYAAGVMPKVEKEEYTFEKDRAMIEVNLLGAMAWLNEAAQFMSRVKRGTIVGISSIAGDRGRRGNPAYCTSKAAMNTYLESLRNRLDQHAVRVVTIKPGFVDTGMTRGMKGLFWLITADEAARRILVAAKSKCQTVYVPHRWRLVGLIIRAMPSFIFRKLDI